MAKMIFLHRLVLKPGVTPEQFEQFVASEFHNQRTPPGWTASIVKSTRGDRVGSYAFVYEVDVAALNRDMIAPGEKTETMLQWEAQLPPNVLAFDARLEALVDDDHFADYFVIAEEAES